MRGSIILFSGLLSVICLKRRLQLFHWFGMMIAMLGLVLVGAKSVFDSESSRYTPTESAIGISLVLLGAFTSSVQMIVEEVLLQDKGYHPLQAVGAEGIYGTVVMAVIALPAVHFIPGSDLNGSYENVLDALYQLGSNPVLLTTAILYLISMAWFNYFGFTIAKNLNTVYRTLIDALRTASVWTLGLLLHYTVGPQFGEAFHLGWGIIELSGFVLLVIGTLIYNRVLDLTFIPICTRSFGFGKSKTANVDMQQVEKSGKYLPKNGLTGSVIRVESPT